MAYTSHGHHIDGTTLSSDHYRPRVARCGGPRLCNQCAREAAALVGGTSFPFLAPKPEPSSESYYDKARALVLEYALDHMDRSDKEKGATLDLDGVYVVIGTYVLGNWKCLVSTVLLDGMYYEVTHNGEKGETYLDAYKKFDNKKFVSSATE